MNVRIGTVLKYTLLPGIIPRISDMFTSGFSFLSVIIAQCYYTVRLLPAGHPYLNPANTGKFGVRHVIREARRHLVFKKENIDQILIYYILYLALFLFLLQAVLFVGSVMVKGVFAAPPTPLAYYAGFFSIADPSQDIAFRLLDYVFCFDGSPGGGALPIFNSDVVQNGTCPTSVHTALHVLFEYYNIGLVIVGVIIFLYMITTIVAETAQSGTPFGQRFNHAMAPLRLIVAIGLLVPLSYGINGAQHITLRIAKWGSNLATNGWIEFNTELSNAAGFSNDFPMTGLPQNLVVRPNSPQFNSFLEFMMVSWSCRFIEKYINKRDIQAYQVEKTNQWPMPATFQAALNNIESVAADAHDDAITIRFGELDPDVASGGAASVYKNEKGYVKPICGEFIINTKDVRAGGASGTSGAYELQRLYYEELVYDMATDWLYEQDGEAIAMRMTSTNIKDPFTPVPNAENIYADYIHYYNEKIDQAILDARLVQINDPRWFEDLTHFGWAGAAIWYNKIAELNGSFIASAHNLPVPRQYPLVMQYVLKERESENNTTTGPERFNPYLSDGQMIEFERPGDIHVAMALYYAQSFWEDKFAEPKPDIADNMIISLFGLEGLYNMRDNLDVNPLAQLAGIGRSLIESAVRNLGFATASGIFGGVAAMMGKNPGSDGLRKIGAIGSTMASFGKGIAMMGLMIGFILYYVVPFLPFVYFFFAVGGWVKSIFEAMVGVPLWALAHIRIDGEGIPGPAAKGGYYLLLDIFLRPILTVTGLVCSISIFSAQAQVLHSIWKVAITNITGHDPTPGNYAGTGTNMAATSAPTDGSVGSVEFFADPIDSFFYLIIYAIIIYMLGMASFKTIDQIPNYILRWMKANVAAFSEQAGDPAGELVSNMYIGGNYLTSAMGRGMGGLFSRNS